MTLRSFPRFRFFPLFEVSLTLRAVPFQFLAVNAQVAALPALASEHQPAGQIAASAAGREGLGVEGEFQRVS